MKKYPRDILVVIDPGHAENTPGKRDGNPVFYEYLGNRRVARKLKLLLEAAGFRVMFSCDLDSPNDLSLAGRANAAKRAGADVFISIHTNAVGNPSVRGTETFIHTNSQSSLAIARAVHQRLLGAIGQNDRGVKRANFGVLRNTYQHMLSILTEADFFTNPTARNWMFQESFDDAYAGAVANGVFDYYGVSADVEPVAPASKPAPSPKPVVTDDIGATLVRVKAKELWVYDKPDWNARTFTVKQDEAFTVVKELVVNGSKMYQLKSGLYITANTQFVELDGKITSTQSEKTPAKPAPKYIRLIVLKTPYMRGEDIKAVQSKLGVKADGIYGPLTEAAVRAFQRKKKITVDGKVGPQTWGHLF